jgi:hypothetical protein
MRPLRRANLQALSAPPTPAALDLTAAGNYTALVAVPSRHTRRLYERRSGWIVGMQLDGLEPGTPRGSGPPAFSALRKSARPARISTQQTGDDARSKDEASHGNQN